MVKSITSAKESDDNIGSGNKPSSAKLTVPIGYALDIFSQAAAEGIDVNQLLISEQIDPKTLDELTHFPADKFAAVYQKIMYETQDEYFGMLSAGKLPTGTFRMMCHAIIHASSLGSAIQRASDFHEICRGANIKPVLLRQGKTAKISFSALENMTTVEEQAVFDSKPKSAICTSLSMWHHFISWLIGQKIPLKSAYFNFPESEALPNASAIFQSEVRFDKDHSAITFETSYLDYPIVQTESTLHSFLKTAPYQLVAMADTAETLTAQVKALIGRDCSIAPPTAEEAAHSLNMSLSTLRRRLLEEGSSFQQIKDKTRKQSAIDYMSSPQLSINEVVELMGFDELSAFYRSFKRWTGMTPSQFRKQQKY
jgi:AraC-like DNA-binding protein